MDVNYQSGGYDFREMLSRKHSQICVYLVSRQLSLISEWYTHDVTIINYNNIYI